MSLAKLTSKGQMTVPVEVRKKLALKPGDRVLFVQLPEGGYKIIAANRPITALKGIVPKPKKPVSLEEMETAIMEGAIKDSGLK